MISILVSTCDSYHDVLDLFFAAFKENWPNCHFDILINGETKKYEMSDSTYKIENYLSNDNRWGARLLSSLNKIEDEFVITLLDDYILESPLDNEKLKNAFSLLQDDTSVSCIYLYYLSSLDMIHSNIDQYYEVSNKSLYKVNTLPAIWRRKDLINILEDQDDPWAWEAFSMYRIKAKNIKIYSVPANENNVYNYSAITGGAVYRGKWVKAVVCDKISKYNLPNDFTKREYLETKEVSKRSFKWKLNFLIKGYKIAKFNLLIFVFQSLKSKWK